MKRERLCNRGEKGLAEERSGAECRLFLWKADFLWERLRFFRLSKRRLWGRRTFLWWWRFRFSPGASAAPWLWFLFCRGFSPEIQVLPRTLDEQGNPYGLGSESQPLSDGGGVFILHEVKLACLSLGKLSDIGNILLKVLSLAGTGCPKHGFIKGNDLKVGHGCHSSLWVS
jgi:hypothetical protein